MAEWGTKYYGITVPVKEEDEVVKGAMYEAKYETPVDIPDAIEAPLITELRKLSDRVTGQETTYMNVKGRSVTVQWRATTASPISVGTIIAALIVLAAILAIALALVSVGRVYGAPASTAIIGGGFILVMFAILVFFMLITRRRK